MITEGLILTGLGMGIVFAFLALLILFMSLTSKIVARFFPDKEAPIEAPKASGSADVEIAIAIAAAKASTN